LESEASVDAELEAAFNEEAEPESEELDVTDVEEDLDDDLESEASVDAELEAAFNEEAEPESEESSTKSSSAAGAITTEFLQENYGEQVESIVREMTQTLLQKMLPQLLEQVIREELDRIKNGS
ncbi:MAG: hypothetical protein HQL67_12855, partial [Magnetococcales bacterium]|nr:hypothetical protein [Magnetococcales bacterium]